MQGFNTAVKLVDVLFLCLQLLQCSRSVCVQISNVALVVSQACVQFFEFRFEANISFVDFGMAEFREKCDNTVNLQFFIRNLSLLDQKFKVVIDLDTRQRLISTFLKNVNTPTSTIANQFLEGVEPLFGNDFF